MTPDIPEKIVEDNHWWFASRTRALNAVMGPLLPESEDFRLLDVGCGAGNMIHHLSRYGRVKGLDIDQRPVEVARQRGYDVDQFDVTQPMPFEPDTFDAVTALDVIEHNEDDLAILADSYRVLKPGGHIIITVPALMWLWSHNDELNAHRRRYSGKELEEKLARIGFRIRRMTYNNLFVFPLTVSVVLLRRGAGQEVELGSPHFDDDSYQVEMEPAPPLLNTILSAVTWTEAQVLRWLSLPVGTSIICIAERPEA